MSTSVTQSGTTTGAGRSGKGLGFAAAALAVVIAAGFAFAMSQGNDVTASNVESRAPGQAEIDQVKALADEVSVRTQPDSAIENVRYQLTQAGLLESGTYVPFATGSPYVGGSSVQAIPERMDGNIDTLKARLELAGLLDRANYVPSIVQPVEVLPERMDGNLDVVKSELEQAGLLDEPAEPEWDHWIP